VVLQTISASQQWQKTPEFCSLQHHRHHHHHHCMQQQHYRRYQKQPSGSGVARICCEERKAGKWVMEHSRQNSGPGVGAA